MKLHFYKYQGAGNDFIIIDNRDGKLELSNQQIKNICDRRFGIGADGLMLLNIFEGFDFRMQYFNSNGSESTMCGNGGRCIAQFAYDLGIVANVINFMAIDGVHNAVILNNNEVALSMIDVHTINFRTDNAVVLNTGSPHYIQWVSDDLNTLNVQELGSAVRNSEEFIMEGINVNFVQIVNGQNLNIRTYERGVEEETLACGTGVTAAAIASTCGSVGVFNIQVNAIGGTLNVSFEKEEKDKAVNVILTGPANKVFEGKINIE